VDERVVGALAELAVLVLAGDHVITAADPLPGDLQQALDAIAGRTMRTK